jgi:hypothetical protein
MLTSLETGEGNEIYGKPQEIASRTSSEAS